MKKVLALALALCMVFSFCAMSASAEKSTTLRPPSLLPLTVCISLHLTRLSPPAALRLLTSTAQKQHSC